MDPLRPPERKSDRLLGAPILIGVSGRHEEWHGPEGTHRWTAAEEAAIPLDQSSAFTAVSLRLANWLPAEKLVRVVVGSKANKVMIGPGQTVEIALPLRDTPSRVVLQCGLTRLDEHGASTDSRSFGIAVQRLTYHQEPFDLDQRADVVGVGSGYV